VLYGLGALKGSGEAAIEIILAACFRVIMWCFKKIVTNPTDSSSKFFFLWLFCWISNLYRLMFAI
jgi:hypothetical protein